MPKAYDDNEINLAVPAAAAVPDPGPAALPQPAEEQDDRETFVVKLEPRHAQYLRLRAEMNGRTPEQHLADILRIFRAHHDQNRPDQRRAPVQQGEMATTFRG